MIAKFFAKSEPLKTAQLLVILLIFFCVNILVNENVEWTWSFIGSKVSLLFLLLFYVLISDFIIRKNYLTSDNSFALLLIVLFFGVFRNSLSSTDLILSNVILLLACRKIYSLRSGKNIKGKLFDAGFWIGVSSLFYVWSIWFLPLVIAGALLYKRHEFRNFLIPILGSATPVFLHYVYHFYFDSTAVFQSHWNLKSEGVTLYYESPLLWPLLLLGVLFLATVVFVSPKATTQSYNFKNSWSVLLYQLLIATIIIYFVPEKNGAEFVFLFFPLSVLIANLFQSLRSAVLKNLVFYALLSYSVITFIYNF